MARKPPPRIVPEPDFHPFRRRFRLPEPVVSEGCVTFDRKGGTGVHEGVAALLELPGIQSVTLAGFEVSIVRVPESCSWEELLPRVGATLERHFLGRPPLDAIPGGEAGDGTD